MLHSGRWVWVHCASVGEFNTVRPILKELRRKFSVFLTYFSPRAEEYLKKMDGYDVLFPVPLDLPPLVRRLEDLVRPRAVIIVERELWPSLIASTRSKKILLSARSTGDPLERILSKHFSLIVARTERDGEMFRRFGAENVVVCGNLKFVQDTERIPVDLRVPKGYKLIVAGSTHRGEEELILKTYLKLRDSFPLRLILAPRHLARLGEVVELLERYRISWCRRTAPKDWWEVMLLDTLGELRGFYQLADVAFVGGTLVPVGGHNLLEPALFGKPVVFGPHTQKVRDLEEFLISEGYGFRVSEEELGEVLYSLLREGFRPKRDIRDTCERIRGCYLKAVLSELE